MQAVQSYTLPPDKLIQAVEFAHARHQLYFASVLVSALVLLAIIRLKIVPRMRGLHPALIVAAVVLLTAFFDLPAAIYGHSISLRYHISIEAWPEWFGDWTKAQLVSLVIAIVTAIPFYALLRRSPQRWWLYAWLVALPLLLASAFADPLIFEPLFNRFEPLAERQPQLISPIERLLIRAGVAIPTDHLFEMQASQKTNALNAYVSGFGPSRRLVLYDTIIRKEPPGPLLTTIGHEVGHYVLHHISQGLVLGWIGTLAGLLILFYAMRWFIARWGAQLDIRDVAGWPSLPVFLLFILILDFFSDPLANALSRRIEHQADVYSLEVTHGLIADPGQAAAQAFQIEGETDLEEPAPNPLIVFWLYSHPPIADRLRFSLTYDPWKEGRQPEFVK